MGCTQLFKKKKKIKIALVFEFILFIIFLHFPISCKKSIITQTFIMPYRCLRSYTYIIHILYVYI